VLNEVRDITLARNTRNGLVALVSYENKVCSSWAGYDCYLLEIGAPATLENGNGEGPEE